MTASRSIGTGAVGLGAPPPSPGQAALVTVEHFLDGEHVHTHVHTSEHTPADVIDSRVKGLRWAGSRFERDGNVLTSWHADGRSQRMTVVPQPGADRTCTECGEPVDRDGLTTGECGGGGGQKCGECFACSCDGSC